MAKSDEILERIELDKSQRPQNDPTWSEGKLINAFDTETYKGSVFMLSYSIGGENDYIGNSDISELSEGEIIDIICNYKTRSAINIWYNLDFDANAILSGILNDRELTELQISSRVTTTIDGTEYDITYIKGKFLKFSDENNNLHNHYDISQFFYMSLDDAAEKWLDKSKVEEIDTERFDEKDYIKSNYDTICEYAKKDAKLTHELGIKLIKQAEKLDIPMGMPISTGYLSAEYLRANTQNKPNLYNTSMQNMFWESYNGGRFEVFERGFIGDIVAPDINSAYPAIMKDLPNPATLDWERYNNKDDGTFSFDYNPFDFSTLENGDYGVVEVRVTTNPNKKIQPFAYKHKGKVTYPVLTDKVITVLKPIFEFAVKNDYVVDYNLRKAWIGNKTEETTYPFDFIGDIYADRKDFEILQDWVKKGMLLKIVLNSLYGKTCQTTEKKEIRKVENIDKLEDNEKIYPEIFLGENLRKQLDDNEVIIARHETGRRFNPFFASYITGMTRLELHKAVKEHNLVDDTVMFATDCLMVRKDAYEQSNFNSLIHVPNEELDREQFRQDAIESLGKWDFDYEGKAFIVGSGVYEVDKGKCQNKNCENYGEWCDNRKHRCKLKTRGFQEQTFDKTLYEKAKESPEGIELENNRPLTIAEVLEKPDRGNVSEFVEPSKVLKPDFDTKRKWKRDNIDFTDLLHKSEKSEPLDLKDEQRELLSKVQQIREQSSGKKLTNDQIRNMAKGEI